MWEEDIQEYCHLRGREPDKVHGILLRKGWEPENYTSRMRDALFDFLDKWYTLSIKKLPVPATTRQKNPTTNYLHVTKLPGLLRVETKEVNNAFVTKVFEKNQIIFSAEDSSIITAVETHLNCIEDLLHE